MLKPLFSVQKFDSWVKTDGMVMFEIDLLELYFGIRSGFA